MVETHWKERVFQMLHYICGQDIEAKLKHIWDKNNENQAVFEALLKPATGIESLKNLKDYFKQLSPHVRYYSETPAVQGVPWHEYASGKIQQ